MLTANARARTPGAVACAASNPDGVPPAAARTSAAGADVPPPPQAASAAAAPAAATPRHAARHSLDRRAAAAPIRFMTLMHLPPCPRDGPLPWRYPPRGSSKGQAFGAPASLQTVTPRPEWPLPRTNSRCPTTGRCTAAGADPRPQWPRIDAESAAGLVFFFLRRPNVGARHTLVHRYRAASGVGPNPPPAASA